MRRGPAIPWLGLLCLGLPLLAGSQPVGVGVGRVRADIKGLAKTIAARIQQQRLPSVGIRISGLDFIPEDVPAASLGTMGQALSVFQQVLPQLPREEPVDQIALDLENLRSLLRVLASRLGCSREEPPTDRPPRDLAAISPYSATAVTLHRLREILQRISKAVNEAPGC